MNNYDTIHPVALSSGIAAILTNKYDHLVAKSQAFFEVWTEAFRPVIEQHDVLEVESEFSFPLLNPETEAPSKSFVEAGKIDGVLRDKTSGLIKVLEHKTTSKDIESGSKYWMKLMMDSQISKYILSLKHRQMDASTVLYDVVSKPAHKAKENPVLDEDGVKVVRNAAGERVRTKDGKKWRESADSEQGYVLETKTETPQEHYARVKTAMQADLPGYFAQREIPRSDADLLEYMNDAWALSQQILQYRRAGLWPRNPDACDEFGGCEFFMLCTGHASVDGVQFRVKAKSNPELETLPGDKQFLTNSRLSSLRKCSRLHFLKYESPTEPVGAESDALRIGTLFHLGCETYLKQFIGK